MPERIPGRTAESRERRCINLAVDLAEKQLREGTAGPSVITHYLKLGTTRAQFETERMRLENELLAARTDAIKSAQRTEELYTEAINAMKRYSGQYDDEDYYDD